MPKYGGRELSRKGMKGTSTGLPDDKAMRQWMPGVLFEPQETGPINKANCRPVEPTWFYQEQDMPTFRPRGPGDIEDIGNEPRGIQGYPAPKPRQTGVQFHPTDWDYGYDGPPPRTSKKKGRV